MIVLTRGQISMKVEQLRKLSNYANNDLNLLILLGNLPIKRVL